MNRMFHVKHVFIIIITVLAFWKSNAQGSIRMSANVITYNLPEDIGLRKVIAEGNEFSTLSKDEREVLYFLDYARKNPSIFLNRAINVFAAGHPEINSNYVKTLQDLFKNLSPRNIILPDSIISKVSRSHAHDLEIHQIISHNSSNGMSFQQRVGPYIKSCGSEAIHASPRFTPLEAVLMLLFDFNVPDLGHRKALLNDNFTKVGIGVAMSHTGNSILVIDFSCQ